MWVKFVDQYLRLSSPGVSKNYFFTAWHNLHHVYAAKEGMSAY